MPSRDYLLAMTLCAKRESDKDINKGYSRGVQEMKAVMMDYLKDMKIAGDITDEAYNKVAKRFFWEDRND